MKRRQPLTIRHTLWLVIALTISSTVLGASALYSYQLYRTARHAEDLRVQTIAETYAVQVGPFLLAGENSQAANFVNKLAWHPTTCLLAILRPNGKPVTIRGNAPLLERYLAMNASTLSNDRVATWHIPGDPEHLLPELNLAAAPIKPLGATQPQGTLVYAARSSEAPTVTHEEVWQFFSNLLAIAVLGAVMGFWWLKRRVLDPLTTLTDQAHGKHSSTSETTLSPAIRSDEIGHLARVLNDMHLGLEEWRERAVRLERTVNERVAAETRKITRELKRVEKKAWTDPLTRLGNRRLLDERFADILYAQQEAHDDLSIVMIDIDYFKPLNDTLGHKAGDELLVFLGELLQQCLREQDLAIRYGGDEFVLILPAVAAEDAHAIAKRMIALFNQRARLLRSDPKPSMSAGIASLWRHRPKTPEEILKFADEALYAAKKAGKAQAVIYQPHPAIVKNR